MSAAQMGMSPYQVDEMTPREFAAAVEAYKNKLEQEQEQRRQEIYVSALLVSRFVWAKKVPPYERVFRAAKCQYLLFRSGAFFNHKMMIF